MYKKFESEIHIKQINERFAQMVNKNIRVRARPREASLGVGEGATS